MDVLVLRWPWQEALEEELTAYYEKYAPVCSTLPPKMNPCMKTHVCVGPVNFFHWITAHSLHLLAWFVCSASVWLADISLQTMVDNVPGIIQGISSGDLKLAQLKMALQQKYGVSLDAMLKDRRKKRQQEEKAVRKQSTAAAAGVVLAEDPAAVAGEGRGKAGEGLSEGGEEAEEEVEEEGQGASGGDNKCDNGDGQAAAVGRGGVRGQSEDERRGGGETTMTQVE